MPSQISHSVSHTQVGYTNNTGHISTPPSPDNASRTSESGSLAGRQVQSLPHAQHVKASPPSRQTGQAQRPVPQVRVGLPAPQLVRLARFGALPSSNELMTRAGRPKDDIRFGLFTLQRSSEYKAILNGLNAYHALTSSGAMAAQGAGNQSTRVLVDAAETLQTQLDTLAQAAERYGSNSRHTRTGAIEDLRTQIAHERTVLQGVINEFKAGGALPAGASIADVIAFAREGVSLADMTRLLNRGLLPSQASDARELIDSERGRSLLGNPAQLSHYAQAGFNADEAYLLEVSGARAQGGSVYRTFGLPITHQTIFTSQTDAHRLGTVRELGHGAFNQVYAVRYGSSNGVENGVFKPLSNHEGGWVAAKIGIQHDAPRTANRNLATTDVARALGFDVVVDCRIGTCRVQGEDGVSHQRLGMVMGHAPGRPAHECSYTTLRNPEVQRQITKLQLLDHIVGQGDRHGGNYFVDVAADGRVKVSGIDNDQCFGERTLHGDDIRWSNHKERHGYRGTLMPPVVDTEMAQAILSLTPDALQKLVGDKLSPAEMQAAHSRLESVQNHIQGLQQLNLVIEPEQWGESPHADLFTSRNSYFARDLHHAVDLF